MDKESFTRKITQKLQENTSTPANILAEPGIQLGMDSFEKFTADELKTLRDELRQSGLDSFQCAELLAAFLNQHGYGVSNHDARTAAGRIEQLGFALPHMQEELERLAWVM